jgi:hypothetical protein
MSSSESVTCITCANSGPADDVPSWHSFRHPLKTAEAVDVPNVFGKKPVSSSGQADAGPQVSLVQSSMPFDPVLRQALINKGVLTPQDLRDAEATIAVVTGLMTQGVVQDVPSSDQR